MKKNFPWLLFFGAVLGSQFVTGNGLAQTARHVEIHADQYQAVAESFVQGFLEQHDESGQTLDEMVLSLTQALHQSGYVLATVTQTKAERSGSVGLMVHLGTISRIELQGFNSEASEQAAREILEIYLLGQPLHQSRLERATMLVNDLSDVSARTSLLEESPGRYQLVVADSPIGPQTTLQYDFVPTREFKRNRLNLTHSAKSVVAGGDLLRLSVIAIDGDGAPSQTGGGAYYRTPIGSKGFFAALNVSDIRSRVELSTNQELQFDGRSYSMTVGYPVTRDVHGYRYLMAQLQRTEEKIEGVVNDNQVDLGRLIYVSKKNDSDASLLDASVVVTAGNNDDSGLGDFSHLRLALGKVWPLHHLSPGSHFKADLFVQMASDTLPASERFYLGSTTFLRGYPYSSEVGDKGYLGSLEWGKVIQHAQSWVGLVQHALFFDFGSTRATQGSDVQRSSRDLYSLGYSVKASLGNGFGLNAWVAAPLAKTSAGVEPNPNVYLQLSKSW